MRGNYRNRVCVWKLPVLAVWHGAPGGRPVVFRSGRWDV